MTRFRLFCLKNAMFTANLLATAIGSGLLYIISQLVRDVEDSGQFMTLFYLTVDPVNQSLQWVRAGHDPGIFYDPATNTFEDLKGNGIALGVDEDWQFEMNEKMGLAKGQIIVLSTDGVWEAHNQTGEIFGKARLYEIIRQNSAKKAEEIVEAVLAALDQFQKDSEIEDDITLVVIKIEDDFINPDE